MQAWAAVLAFPASATLSGCCGTHIPIQNAAAATPDKHARPTTAARALAVADLASRCAAQAAACSTAATVWLLSPRFGLRPALAAAVVMSVAYSILKFFIRPAAAARASVAALRLASTHSCTGMFFLMHQ